MIQIELILSDYSAPQLVETCCRWQYGTGEQVNRARRSLDKGIGSADCGSFGWTRAVQALTVFLLRWAAWGRSAQQDASSVPVIRGKRKSMASTLNDALTKKPLWLLDVFGCDSNGRPNVDFIRRSNPDFKTPSNYPVELFLDRERLAPRSIKIKVDRTVVEDANKINDLANKIAGKYFKADGIVSTIGKNNDKILKRIAKGGKDVCRSAIGNPPSPPELFLGRDADLKRVKDLLGIQKPSGNAKDAGNVVVIRGWPGVGKSTMVAALANNPDVIEHFKDGILWTSLGQTPDIHAELANWGRLLGNENVLKASDISNASKILANMLRNKELLLIVDDVWEVAHGAAFKIGGSESRMLVTTRLPLVAQGLAFPSMVYVVPPLTEEVSIKLLAAYAPYVVKGHPDQCRELVKELQGLPFALRVAGRMLNVEDSHEWGVDQLLKELRDNKNCMLDSDAPSDMIDLVEETTPSVAALLRKSTDRLTDRERECFAVLGAFAPEPATFGLDAMAAVWGVADPKPIIRVLIARGLLEPIGEARFQMHTLLVTLAKSLLKE